jgi:hypothetical protein
MHPYTSHCFTDILVKKWDSYLKRVTPFFYLLKITICNFAQSYVYIIFQMSTPGQNLKWLRYYTFLSFFVYFEQYQKTCKVFLIHHPYPRFIPTQTYHDTLREPSLIIVLSFTYKASFYISRVFSSGKQDNSSSES